MQTPPQPPAAPTPPVAPTLSASQAAASSNTLAPVATQSNVFTYSQLRARGDELSRQLRSATSRRDGLARDLRRASDQVREGVQSQITELNGRIVLLEKDIAQNGQSLATAKGLEAAAGSLEDASSSQLGPASFMPSPDDMTAITIVFTLFVLCPIALSLSRLIWKRASRIGMTAPVSRESDMRMERVEQAVDAIAVEVERISEGQRFVTQLMTQQPALGQGAASPVRVPVAEAVGASWQQR
ncbi:MAG: hypothetical protein ABJB74_19150 [Gemmatimonas sp.]